MLLSKKLASLGFSILLCLSCSAPPSELPETPSGQVPESATRALLREAVASINRGEIEPTIDLLRADFHYLPPGPLRFSTAHGFQEALETFLGENRVEISFSTESVAEDQLVAATRHRFVATLTGGQGSRVINGTALIVFERRQPEGEWQATQLVWNGEMQTPSHP